MFKFSQPKKSLPPAGDEQHDAPDKEESLISHLIELRQRLIYILIFWLVLFVVLYPFKEVIYNHFAIPAIKSLSADESFIIPHAIDAFLIPLKLCLFISFMITLPWTLFQVWGFVSPGLYRHEKRLVMPIIVSSTALFYIGVLFAYFVVLPMMFSFLAGIQLENVKLTPDINNYFSVALTLFIAFGVAFEVPVLTVILVLSGMVEIDSLRSKRRYIIVGSFFVAMFLTPPDVMSQFFMAIPMWFLFEIGLLCAAYLEKKGEAEREEDLDSDEFDEE